jgi:hypothetical protein
MGVEARGVIAPVYHVRHPHIHTHIGIHHAGGVFKCCLWSIHQAWLIVYQFD